MSAIQSAPEITWPDSDICVAAHDLVKDVSPAFLYNHLMRSYAFGAAIGQKQSKSFDAEMLFLGAVMHDLAFVDQFENGHRFEVDSANAAKEFLSERGYDDKKIDVIWQAIALHSTHDVPQFMAPEVALVQFGAGLDVGMFPYDALEAKQIDEIVELYPRLGFKKAIIETLGHVVQRNPRATVTTFLEHVGHRCVDHYHAPNFVDIVTHSPFAE